MLINFTEVYIVQGSLLIDWDPIKWDSRVFECSIIFIAFSGLMLVYLNNISFINSKIKEYFNRGSDISIIQNKQDEYDISASYTPLNIFFAIFSFVLFVLFFYNYFSFDPMIEPETYGTFHLRFKTGSNVIKDFFPTVFNLDNYEGGAYRPRVIAFIIEYININMLPILNRLMPFWGMRLIFTVISILFSIFAVYLLLNSSLTNNLFGLKLFLSVLPIYFVHVQTSLGIYQRTSRYLVIPLCLFILYYFINNYKKIFVKKNILMLSISIFFVFLCTLYDEQLVACVLYFSLISSLMSIINKKIYNTTIVFTSSIVLYVFWYLVIGKYLFTIFTPHALLKHGHQYSLFFKILLPYSLYDCITLYYTLISSNLLICSPIIILLLIFTPKKYMRENRKELFFIPILTLVLSFLLVCASAVGHIHIVNLPDMKYSTYLAPSLFLFYSGSIFFLCKIIKNNSAKGVLTPIIIISLIITVLIHHNNWQRYYNTHTVIEIGSLKILEMEEIERQNYSEIILLDELIKEHKITNQKYIYLYSSN
jgi:hypothetical protein